MRKPLMVRLSTGILFLIGAWAAYTQTPQAQPPIALEKVKDDLYVISNHGGNVAAYTTDEGVIVVDDKFDADVAEILAKIKSVTDKPVKYVLNTHQHGDHTGGNQKLLPMAEIIIHENARANMVEGKMPGVPRVTYSDQTGVFLGGKEVLAKHFGRGHTNGDAAIYFPALKVVHTGDLFVTGAPFIDYSAHASAREWAGTIDGILKWDFDTVIPGHGPVSKRADLIKFRDGMAKLCDRVGGMVRDGKAKDDVSKVLLAEFGWTAAGTGRSLDGLMAEFKQ
jgi:glyoxylase-like metal-dependent hydrolase (beta-lactamase superfamily II)